MAVPGQEWDYETMWRNRLISAENTVMTAFQGGQVLGFAAMTAPRHFRTMREPTLSSW